MTLPLFAPAGTAEIEQALLETFEAWVAHRAHSGSTRRDERALAVESADMYRDMWRSFATFCAPRRLQLADLEADDLQTYLTVRGGSMVPGPAQRAQGAKRPAPLRTKGADLSERYAWRLLWLVDRIGRYAADQVGVEPNLAAFQLLQLPPYRFANAADRDALPEYLQETQARRLIAHVTEIRSKDSTDEPLTWKELRDRTAVAVMLGGGLTPGDVRALTLSGVIIDGGRKAGVPWKLSLPGNGNFPARETPLASWAGRQLALWLAVRAEQRLAGEFVFPATAGGRAWSHTRCYESCKVVLVAAGFRNETAGGLYKLRHTFALRQLAKGKSDADVARWLGLADLTAMARYRRIVPWQVELA